MALKVQILNDNSDSVRCLLCLNVEDEIMAISQEQNMFSVLCLHFWFPSEDVSGQSICKGCWNSVEEFHRFYQKVKQAYADHPISNESNSSKLVNEAENEEVVEIISELLEDSYVSARESEQNNEFMKESYDGSNIHTELTLENEEDAHSHRPWLCHNCDVLESTYDQLVDHIWSTHKAGKYVECCGRRFSKHSTLQKHVTDQGNSNDVTCVVCSKMFSNRAAWHKHKMRHNSSKSKILQCDLSGQIFEKQDQLKHHQKLHVVEGIKHISRPVCSKIFVEENRLDDHLKRVHDREVIVTRKHPEQLKTMERFLLHDSNSHQSRPDNREECKVCHRWLKNRSSLRKHMYRHQSSGKSNVCDICGKNAPNALALNSHKVFVHQKKRSFQCDICMKAFKRAFTLEEHMTTHTGETLYSCPYCSKTFNSSANMHAHRKRAHPREWEESRIEYEKQFKCQ